MATLNLTATQMKAGVWEAILSVESGGEPYFPDLVVTHLEQPVPDVMVVENPEQPGQWMVRVPIPPATLSDGVQTFVVTDAKTGATLSGFTIIAGEPLDADIRAEVDLLRAELDLLKRAFRRHCLETAG